MAEWTRRLLERPSSITVAPIVESPMASTLFDLSGRGAVVSGAARGLGRAMAMALAEAGADLMLVDRNGAGAEATAAAITSIGRRAVARPCDVSEPAQIRALFGQL